MIVGEWDKGIYPRVIDYQTDPSLHSAGRAVVREDVGAMKALIERIADSFPDRKALEEFVNQITGEIENPKYHLYQLL